MNERKIKLGEKYRDTITGFEGTATGKHEYLHGCLQISLTGIKDREPVVHTFDAPQLRHVLAHEDRLAALEAKVAGGGGEGAGEVASARPASPGSIGYGNHVDAPDSHPQAAQTGRVYTAPDGSKWVVSEWRTPTEADHWLTEAGEVVGPTNHVPRRTAKRILTPAPATEEPAEDGVAWDRAEAHEMEMDAHLGPAPPSVPWDQLVRSLTLLADKWEATPSTGGAYASAARWCGAELRGVVNRFAAERDLLVGVDDAPQATDN